MRNPFHILSILQIVVFFYGSSLVFVSCEDNTMIPAEKETQQIIIAYLAGDGNGLSSEIGDKVEALTQGFLATDHTNNKLFIYYDRNNTSPQLIEISEKEKENHYQILKTYTEQNSASAEVMSQVLKDVLDNYQAKNYGLILFSHGTAWLPAGGLESPYYDENEDMNDTQTTKNTRTVCSDNKDEMDLIDFATSLPLPDGKKWNFILFEGCYMGSIEVAYELKDKTEAIIASPTEIVSPGMEEVYPSALAELYKNTPDLESFARSYFDTWNNKTGNYRSATISVIRTEQLEELTTLARAAFLRWEPDTQTIKNLQYFNRNKWHLFFDLKEMILAANPALETYINNLWPQIVTYAAATPTFLLPDMAYGFTIKTFGGINSYIPQDEFVHVNRQYKRTAWCKAVYTNSPERVLRFPF